MPRRREPPTPTVVEVYRVERGEPISKWAVLWSDGTTSRNLYRFLPTACRRAAYEQHAWRLWCTGQDDQGRAWIVEDWP